MNDAQPSPASSPPPIGSRETLTEALRYWEPRRLIYNGVLAAIVVGYYAINLPYSQTILSFNAVLVLFLLAVLANICYCAAYVADVFVQASGLDTIWRRWRWLVLLIGTTFAAIIARFIAMAAFTPPLWM